MERLVKKYRVHPGDVRVRYKLFDEYKIVQV